MPFLVNVGIQYAVWSLVSEQFVDWVRSCCFVLLICTPRLPANVCSCDAMPVNGSNSANVTNLQVIRNDPPGNALAGCGATTSNVASVMNAIRASSRSTPLSAVRGGRAERPAGQPLMRPHVLPAFRQSRMSCWRWPFAKAGNMSP